MYEIKPNFIKYDINLPNCMYQIKNNNHFNFNGGEKTYDLSTTTTCSFDNLNSHIKNLIENTSSMDILEARQDKLLHQLKSFKIRLVEIRKMLLPESNSFPTTNTTVTVGTQPILHQDTKREAELEKLSSFDIVVNAHPKFVPYGLLGVKNLWKNVNFDIKLFSHSTLPEIGPEALQFQKEITKGLNNKSSLPTIKLTLIWKNCEHTELISSPTMYKPIYGEINILRFLARIGPVEYQYDHLVDANLIDAILDICYQIIRCTSAGQKELLIVLSERLQKQKYFGVNRISIADIAVSSTLKRMPQSMIKNLPENLRNWHNTVKTIIKL